MEFLLLFILGVIAFGAINVCVEILAYIGGVLLVIALPFIILALL